MLLERGLDDSALHPPASAVDEPNLAKARRVRCAHVLLDHRRHVPRMKGVEIDLRLDGDSMRHVRGFELVSGHYSSAVTEVVIPPRAEKRPQTVMRRGAHAATRSSRI